MKVKVFLGLIASLAVFIASSISAQASSKGSNPSCDKAWWLKSPNPAKNQYISGTHGSLRISGAACPGNGLTMVALTYGTAVGRYYVSGSTVPSADGDWKISIDHIGSTKDPNRSKYKVFVFGVSDRCITAINGTPASHGVQSFTKWPKGCSAHDRSKHAEFNVIKRSL